MLGIREDFPALRHFTWFQNGGVSLTPRPVHEEHARLMRELFELGPQLIVAPAAEYPRRERTIARLAQFFSVQPGELALMRGVSEAFQTVIRGITWERGDRIVIRSHEEAALLLPALALRDRHGVEVVKLSSVEDEAEELSIARDLFTERTRLVALSHVDTEFGHRLAARPICDLARSRGIPTFLDLAHSAGLFPLPLRELGCDFAGILSYKWMYGPYAAGLLFVRHEQFDRLPVTYPGGRSEAWLDFESDSYALRPTAERFQYGPWSWPLVHAWATAAGYLDDLGLDEVWQRTVLLTDRLKRGLLEIERCTVWTPLSPDRSAAVVTFGIDGLSGQHLATELRERWNIVIKPVFRSGRDGLRASVPFFLLESEIDHLLAALRTLAATTTDE
jgi:selenocysteine lyase/cysteine desulfurase